jgi:hypothetical protein
MILAEEQEPNQLVVVHRADFANQRGEPEKWYTAAKIDGMYSSKTKHQVTIYWAFTSGKVSFVPDAGGISTSRISTSFFTSLQYSVLVPEECVASSSSNGRTACTGVVYFATYLSSVLQLINDL